MKTSRLGRAVDQHLAAAIANDSRAGARTRTSLNWLSTESARNSSWRTTISR